MYIRIPTSHMSYFQRTMNPAPLLNARAQKSLTKLFEKYTSTWAGDERAIVTEDPDKNPDSIPQWKISFKAVSEAPLRESI